MHTNKSTKSIGIDTRWTCSEYLTSSEHNKWCTSNKPSDKMVFTDMFAEEVKKQSEMEEERIKLSNKLDEIVSEFIKMY